jgi:hypothetical protein
MAAVVVACLALAGCGSGGGKVPQGSPDTRHGADLVDTYAASELMRALLIASSDGYFAGGSADDARTQLERARRAYDPLSERVRAGDPVLARELDARFELSAQQLRHGISADAYGRLVTPLFDQLGDGILQAAVPAPVRGDAGVQAEALRRVTLRMGATYDAAIAAAGDTPSRLAFQESWGLWRRAAVLDSMLAGKLGSQKGAVIDTLNNLRGDAFPNGPAPLESPPARKVDTAVARVAQALDRRFGLKSL